MQEVEFISYSIKSLWETPFLRESFFVAVCRMNVGVGNSLLFFAEHSDIQYKFIEFTQNIFIETIYKAKFL